MCGCVCELMCLMWLCMCMYVLMAKCSLLECCGDLMLL
jgi:hypothetical protein